MGAVLWATECAAGVLYWWEWLEGVACAGQLCGAAVVAGGFAPGGWVEDGFGSWWGSRYDSIWLSTDSCPFIGTHKKAPPFRGEPDMPLA